MRLHKLLLVFTEVLRADVFYFVKLLVIFHLQGFSVRCRSIRGLQNNLPIFVTLCADRLVNFIPNGSQLRFKLIVIVFFLPLDIFNAN